MRLTVLMDNNTFIDRYFLGEPAVSYLIEDGEQTILFDAGYSDAFITNASRMGIDLARVTDVVLSHGHNDHTGGLCAFLARFTLPVRLYAHPDAALMRRAEGVPVGSPFLSGPLPAHVTACFSAEPVRVSHHALYMGQIPRTDTADSARCVGEALQGGEWTPDAVCDDTALLLETPCGPFLVSGCTHCGVISLLDRAQTLCGGPVAGLIGGLHLFETGVYLDACCERMRSAGLSRLFPCHCTSLAVKAQLVMRFNADEVGVGLTLTWQDGALRTTQRFALM